MVQTTWATVLDVADITGKDVDTGVLKVASIIIETHVRKIYSLDVALIGDRDAYWLKNATAWQAVWLLGQDDLDTRMNLKEIAEGGRATVLDATALELAPLAKRNINNCSWRRSRSLHVRSPFVDGAGLLSLNPNAEANDGYEQWRPM